MDIIEEIQGKLSRYPHVKYRVAENSVTIFPTSENGFEVSLYINADNAYTVFFEGWHEEFEVSEAALECLAFGLSTNCRLKVHSRGSFPYKQLNFEKTTNGTRKVRRHYFSSPSVE